MRSYRPWVWLLLFGSAWGVGEVVVGGALYKANTAHASVWLAVWGFFVLAVARGVWNKPGSSTVIGGFAALLKLVNAGPFICHLLGIVALAVAFDAAATLVMREERRLSYRSMLCGAVSAYVGYALFALSITYVVRYEYWTTVGLPKVLGHIFVGGSLAALTAAVVVPAGYWVGLHGEHLALRRGRWVWGAALSASAVFWTLARIAG